MTNKISIKGTAPQFDEQELKQHIAARHAEYHGSQESHAHIVDHFLYDLIIQIIELTNQGYILSKQYPFTHGELHHQCFMRKPDNMIAEELTIIDAQTKQSYVAWLESERESYKQQLTAQLIQTAKEKEDKRLADKQAKVLADIQAEVDATFAPLVIPE